MYTLYYNNRLTRTFATLGEIHEHLEVIDPSLRYAWRKVEDGWQICLWFVSKSK